MRATCGYTTDLRDKFANRLRVAGFDVAESFTNFALIRFDSPETAMRADKALRAEGVFLRAQGGAGLADCLRITVGKQDDMNLAATLLERFAKGANT